MFFFLPCRARDIWLMGTLIWEIFNGNGATSASSYRQLGSVPRPLAAAYGDLVNPNPSLRTSLDKLLQSAFIEDNALVECLLFLEQIQVGFSRRDRLMSFLFALVERSSGETNVFQRLA